MEMQVSENIEYKSQIEEAYKRAKCKKALYLYDESGTRQFLGVFSKKRASEIKSLLRAKKLLGRLTEFEVLTTEPDSEFAY
jgi:hypothetical protein